MKTGVKLGSIFFITVTISIALLVLSFAILVREGRDAYSRSFNEHNHNTIFTPMVFLYFDSGSVLIFVPSKNEFVVEVDKRGNSASRYATLNYIAKVKIKGNFNFTMPEKTYGKLIKAKLGIGFKGKIRGFQSSISNQPLDFNYNYGKKLLFADLNSDSPEKFNYEISYTLDSFNTVNFYPLAAVNTVTVKILSESNNDNKKIIEESTVYNDSQSYHYFEDLEEANNNTYSSLYNSYFYGFESETYSIDLRKESISASLGKITSFGPLCLILVFFSMLVIERVADVRLHPFQYFLAGLAIAIFYLLLYAFSEFISYNISYLLASASCLTLLSYYLLNTLKTKHTVVLGILLSIMYAIIFVAQRAPDYSLLLITFIVVLLLGVGMVATRNTNWYDKNNKN